MKPRHLGVITCVRCPRALRQRLCLLGIAPYRMVRVIGRSPLEGNIMVQAEETVVGLSRDEADRIHVEKLAG